MVAGLQVGFLGAVRNRREVTDTEVDASSLITRGVGGFNFVFAHEVQFPPLLRLAVDGPNLLQVLDRDFGASFVFNEDVVPVSRVVFVVRAFREPDVVVLGVVTDTFLFPRQGTAWVFFVDAVSIIVVVVFLAVAGRIRTRVVLPFPVPRVEGFSEFLQNALTGLRMESFVGCMSLQLAFQVRIIENLARVIPHLAGVIVRNVPQFRCTPSVQVEHPLHL